MRYRRLTPLASAPDPTSGSSSSVPVQKGGGHGCASSRSPQQSGARYQRSEQALVGTLAEMYIQVVSIHNVKAITKKLCGHSVSASTISRINKHLDKTPTACAGRELDQPRSVGWTVVPTPDLLSL